jgi:hypothetical protein
MAILYRHIRLDTNQPFYIGIGRTENRAYSKDRRNKHWWAIVNKAGYKTQIMLDDLSWDEACEKEKEFIKLYGRKEFGGLLCNKTDGGEGSINVVCSTETRQKLSKVSKGIIRSAETKLKMSVAQKGRTLSLEHRAKLSEAAKKRPCNRKGVTLSAETKQKMSEAKKRRFL